MILLNCTNEGVTLIAPDGDERTAWPSGYTINIETTRVNHRSVPVSYWGKPYNPTVAMTVKSSIPLVSEHVVAFGFRYNGKAVHVPDEVVAGALLIVSRETAMLASRITIVRPIAACMVWPASPVYNESTHGRLNGTIRAYRELHCIES